MPVGPASTSGVDEPVRQRTQVSRSLGGSQRPPPTLRYQLPLPAQEWLVLESLRSLRQSAARSHAGQAWASVDVGEDLFAVASQLGLVHTVRHALARLAFDDDDDDDDDRAGSVAAPFETYHRVAEVVFALQWRSWTDVAGALAAAGVDCLALKGVQLQAALYPATCRHLANDVDVLVRPEALALTGDVLRELGYARTSRIGDRYIAVDQSTIDDFERDHYELFPFTKLVPASWPGGIGNDDLVALGITHPTLVDGDELYVAVELDVHHNLAPGLDLDDVWHRPMEFTIGGRLHRGVSVDVLAWFLPARFYHEVMVSGRRSGKALADLALLFASEPIDMAVVLRCAERYALAPSLFYVYAFLDEVGAVDLGPAVLDALADLLGRHRSRHDWGDFVPKLLGQRVTFRPTLEGPSGGGDGGGVTGVPPVTGSNALGSVE